MTACRCCSSILTSGLIFSKPAQFFWTSLIFFNQLLIDCLKKGLFFLGCGWKIWAWLFEGGSEKKNQMQDEREEGRRMELFLQSIIHTSPLSLLSYPTIPQDLSFTHPDLFTTPPLHYLFIHFDIVFARIWTTNLQICCHPFSPLDHSRICWRATDICWSYT